ncbi:MULTISPECIES: hypothetical protein [Pseudoalteromonas]|uniref:Uncharacterized protein n=1 Tax=Pseudoalteromonas maricaloris TaxID=184924 RepID=A0A8I2GZM7_9GAMM|nr:MULTISPECIES: hypothetical protein [Pseudoalteromonas]KJY90919.1 hypothetical protein TW73_21090 [Pseudoalteromonas piscicida]NLR21657.1 hypothetical protein [Pseudoalteromonas maricaloris]RZG13706.1 hypothetical protein EXT47_15970 [Pseudoalteromonas sp. CO342X]WOX28201.1 hypothetical protein R5H13_16460 [Pseudoalteromonas maricaloris]
MKSLLFGLLTLGIVTSAQASQPESQLEPQFSTQSMTGDFAWFNAPSQTCSRIRSMMYYRHPGNDHLTPISVPVIYTGGECWSTGRTTSSQGPKEMYTQVSDIIHQQFSNVEHNYKELTTDIVNNIAAQSSSNKVSHTTSLYGTMHMKIAGRVDAQNKVPVLIDGFDLKSYAKFRKKQLGMNIYIHVYINNENVTIKGKYDVRTQQLELDPLISSFKPVVTTKVDLPWILDLIDTLTPGIFDKLYTEFSRIVIDVFEFLGVDMSEDIPQVIKHNAQLINSGVVPLKGLDTLRPGDTANLEMEVTRGHLRIKDGHTSFYVFAIPMLP